MRIRCNLDTISLVCVALAMLGQTIVFAQTPTLPTGFAQTVLADSLNPTAMAFDHHGNLYLAQKDGRVLLLNEAGELLPDPVISLELDDYNERGLAGIALHPDFDNQPWLYLYYSVRDSNFNRISRVRINGNLAVPGSEEVLFECDILNAGIHNGGAMAFGQDGNLYIGTGDGGKSSNSQSLDVTLGKILRLRDDGSIPSNNPFYGSLSGKSRAIFAYGLRNPFGMSIQPGSGRIFVSEVGQGAFEEINEIIPGRNYGWSQIEGPIAGQSPPTDYKDPFFAYPHAEGCAIVGAAFYNPLNASFPVSYVDKFFFADYCNGIIRTLDPNTNAMPDTFATGLKQPVAFAVNPHTGDLFYLMRSGIGGGSVIDNTSTSDGTLWRVFYTGSGAPFVSVPPQDVFLPVGENAQFKVQILGTPPFQFQWQRDALDISGAETATLEVGNVQLSDHGAQFRCIVTNTEGQDTSSAAILRVTANQRPQPQILFPVASQTYKAGDVIHFQGLANDSEDGPLPTSNLRWRVDFHHDTHTHPVLAPVSGIGEGEFSIPLAGETSPNTWYRVYLTATDLQGLERTVFTEIFPEKTTVKIAGPAGLPVNIDGVLRSMPYAFEGLKRQERIVQATSRMSMGDTLYIFEKWRESADNQLIFNFPMPDTPGMTLHAEYARYLLGDGTGLYGEYFIDPEFDLDEAPAATRVDPVVNFNWGSNSPFPNLMPADNFTVRWSGFVETIFSEEYTFSVHSDDGCRLWVGDSLLIDKWVPQAGTEHAGKVTLQAGTKLPIRLEYMEMGGGANVALFWASPSTPKAVIPKRQLYPIDLFVPATLAGKVWLDENANDSLDLDESGLPDVTVLLHEADSSFLAVRISDEQGHYRFENLPPGEYFYVFLTNAVPLSLQPGFGLNAFSQTPFFEVMEGETHASLVAFRQESSTTTDADAPSLRVKTYPNPTQGNLWVEVVGGAFDDTQMSVMDGVGRRLGQVQISKLNEHTWSLDLGQSPSGLYFLMVENGQGRVVRKFVKG